MDKNTLNMKADQIQSLVGRGNYEAAANVADTVEWNSVTSVRLLTLAAAAYEKVQNYRAAIYLLEMAYEESNSGKHILFKLTELAVALGDLNLAQQYYNKYVKEAPDDNSRYLLRYLLAELKGEALDKRIAILETYRKYEFEEQWALRLAELYDEAGMGDACVKLCDEIILYVSVGPNVERAMDLKEKYAPLSDEQKAHRENKEYYEQCYQEVAQACNESNRAEGEGDDAYDASAANEMPAYDGEDDAWMDHIRLIEAENGAEAVEKALAELDAFYAGQEENKRTLTRILAPKLEEMGIRTADAKLGARDLLIGQAALLSDNTLEDLLRLARDEKTERVYILADAPEDIENLDNRLGDILYNMDNGDLPAIEFSNNEEVVLRVEEEKEAEAAKEVEEEEHEIAATKVMPALPAEPAPSEETVPETEAPAEEPVQPAEEPAPVAEEEDKTVEAEATEEPEEELPTIVLTEPDDEVAEQTAVEEPEEEKTEIEEETPAEEAAFETKEEVNVEETEAETKEEISAEEAEEEIKEETPAEEAEAETQEEIPAEEAKEETQAEVPAEEAVAETKEETPSAETEKQSEVPAGEPEEKKEGLVAPQGELTEEEFVEYAKLYIKAIDCVLGDGAEDALYDAAIDRRDAGQTLTAETAEVLIEAAADRAENALPIFGRRYDKAGNLILKAKCIR